MLQAVPILGFFPAAIFFFIRLFHGSPLGVEAAAVFLIFTSQAWNMAFSVYESLTTIPDDLRTAARVSGLSGVVRWRRLLLPACVPRLVYNSMLSWAGGWYFLIASEIIAVGRRSWVLPGLGSYIGESITLGRHGLAAAGLVSLVAVIVLLNVLVWSPLESWSRALPLRDERRRRNDGPAARALACSGAPRSCAAGSCASAAGWGSSWAGSRPRRPTRCRTPGSARSSRWSRWRRSAPWATGPCRPWRCFSARSRPRPPRSPPPSS